MNRHSVHRAVHACQLDALGTLLEHQLEVALGLDACDLHEAILESDEFEAVLCPVQAVKLGKKFLGVVLPVVD
jgi:hypothetical protein